VQIAVQVCSGGCGVYFLFFYGGCVGFTTVLSGRCKNIYTIMAEVIEKLMDDHGLGCQWGVCGYGFWYLRFRWTPSVGVSMLQHRRHRHTY
jgi:hypothetical protein